MIIKNFIIFLFFISSIYGYRYNLCVASIFKDEAPYLKEWIEYHKIQGVEHFYLYDNDSEDNYISVLQPYIDKDEVTLIKWPSSPEDLKNWVPNTQLPMCRHAILSLKKQTQWLAIIDIDEFLFPLEHPTIVSFLEDYKEFPGVLLNWQCFGTSFINEIPKGQLMIETLILRAEEKSRANIPVKSIFKPNFVNISKINPLLVPHLFSYRGGKQAVYPDGRQFANTMDHSKWHICSEKAIINHYAHRTENYFWKVKIAKKIRMEGGIGKQYIKKWYDELNQIEDTRIHRFVSDLRKKVFEDSDSHTDH
jgi:hypothetical protein